ncbi:MAG: thermonuclease family protein [Alphaproteobacteria bacterium]|nr:thermonuclease family protein [Alphaproteobacteria bacterium]
MWRRLVLLVAVLALGGAGPLTPGATGTVASVIDGDTLVLADGTEVRMVGIQAPKLPLGRTHVAEQPYAREAKAALEELCLGKLVRLSYGGLRVDRWGRALAHLYDDRGRWIQGELLARGLARVYTFRDNRVLAAEMLLREAAARAAGRGIWGDPYFAVRSATETPQFLASFQVVEAVVTAATEVRGRFYLGFGPDWRTDLTATVAPRDRALFAAAAVDLAALAGRRVRVRGWLKSYNGPQIEITHPEQIEIIDP